MRIRFCVEDAHKPAEGWGDPFPRIYAEGAVLRS